MKILPDMHGTVLHSVLTQRSEHFCATSLTSECQVVLCSVREANASTVAARCFIAVGYEVLVQFRGESPENCLILTKLKPTATRVVCSGEWNYVMLSFIICNLH